jgi:c-di-GMP-related signal transduction protein
MWHMRTPHSRVLLAAQPIIDREREIVVYELRLYRKEMR